MTEFPSDTVFYAIGDVHGMAHHLTKLHLQILRHHRKHYEGRHTAIIHLGDYVDRGPDSRDVVEMIMSMERRAETNPDLTIVSLKGNHEDMMLQALDGDPAFLDNWLRNGGTETLESYRGPDDDADEAMLRFPRHQYDWLSALPDILILEDRKLVFVHAGIEPREFPDCSVEKHLWTRSRRFFDVAEWADEPNLEGYTVVHGHTPQDAVEYKTAGTVRRINVDTGAVYGGPLTAAVLDGSETVEFLQAE